MHDFNKSDRETMNAKQQIIGTWGFQLEKDYEPGGSKRNVLLNRPFREQPVLN